jgi:hypothetical protein
MGWFGIPHGIVQAESLKKLTRGGAHFVPLADPQVQEQRAGGATTDPFPSKATFGYEPAHVGAAGGGGPPVPS